MKRPYLLEVCVDSIESLENARIGGADRIELCGPLAVGGTTPSYGFIKAAATKPVRMRVMIRPRPGNFIYDSDDLAIMKDDMACVADFGIEGVVFGANRPNDELDLDTLSKLMAMAQALGLKSTLHRSFDLCPDLFLAYGQAHQLGFDTILTSGGAPLAEDGLDTLTKLVALKTASGSSAPEILVGSGIHNKNIQRILDTTGATALHGSFSKPKNDSKTLFDRLGIEQKLTDKTLMPG